MVDDDTAVLKALKIGFETEGFDVRAFSDAESVLAEPDFPESGCLVVDQRLPGLSGLELIAQLRKRDLQLPAVLITTPAPAVMKLAAAAHVPVVGKPLLTNALIDTVRRLVEAQRPHVAETSMLNVSVAEELWNSRVLPEGELTRWRVADGAKVAAGQALAEVRIEGALHEIVSPGDGVLLWRMREGAIVDPGSQIGWIESAAAK